MSPHFHPPSSSTPHSSATNSTSTEKSVTVDPLQLLLERLDSIQGHLVALEKGSTSVSSNEVNMTETITPVTEDSINHIEVLLAILLQPWKMRTTGMIMESIERRRSL